jgi:hypothetical protein
MMQASVILTTDTVVDTAPGEPLDFPVPIGMTAADFLAGQTVYLEVYGRRFEGLATDFMDAVASVTWAADAPYPLPPGEYNIEFQTSAPKELPSSAGQVAAQAPVVLVAPAVDPAADLPTLVAAYNECVAAHDELATAHNALIAAMKASGLMAE